MGEGFGASLLGLLSLSGRVACVCLCVGWGEGAGRHSVGVHGLLAGQMGAMATPSADKQEFWIYEEEFWIWLFRCNNVSALLHMLA